MNEIKVSLIKRQFTSKPVDADAAQLSKLIPDNIVTISQDNIKSFAQMVGNKGCTFCPATFKGGKRNKESFEQLQLLALDFDGGVSFKTVKDRAEQYNLPVLFAYDTFKSVNHNRYRVVFLNDVSIPDPRLAGAILQGLQTIFPEADPNCCKDVSRMYYGGKELLHFDDSLSTINIEALFRNMSFCLKEKHGATHYKRKLAEFSRATGIGLNKDGFLDVSVTENLAENTGTNQSGKNLTNPSKIILPLVRFLPRRYYQVFFGEGCTRNLSEKKRSNWHHLHRSSVLGEIGSSCQLYQEFLTGNRTLHHHELFGLATNLTQIDKGAAKFKEILRSDPETDDKKYARWDYYLRYIKSYKPESCAHFCPYHDQCDHGTNLLSTSKVGYHQFERLVNYRENLVAMEEAEGDLSRSLVKAVQADDTRWHVIKAQTALGKTRAYLELLRDKSLRVLIAVPTNKLKREVQERAANMGIETIVSPSLHELILPDDIRSEIDDLYNSGKPVTGYLKKIVAEDNPECSAVLKEYLSALEAFNSFEGCAITTHRRLLTMDVSKYNLVIVDEDIIFSTIIPNRGNISIADLKKVLKKIAASSPLAAKIRKTLKCIKTNEFFTLRKIPNDKGYADISMAVNIPAFCSATHFCFRKASDRDSDLKTDCVSFMNPVKFGENVKRIMVSATVDEKICNYYFGADNVKFYECKIAQYAGNLNQYGDRSMSRADIAKDTTIFKRIKDWSGFRNTISFKKYRVAGLYDGELSFGNCAGCDYLKGENIDVIGTPHQPEWIYKLFAYSLELDIDTDANIKPNTPVQHNGWSFRFTTYSDEDLRAIQFYMIESELEQAVGRARLLREPCTVNLFSNFPLRQANMEVSGYEGKSQDKD